MANFTYIKCPKCGKIMRDDKQHIHKIGGNCGDNLPHRIRATRKAIEKASSGNIKKL